MSDGKKMEINQDMINLVRKNLPNLIAHDLASVQPMPNTAILDLYRISKSEKELIDEGYEPIDSTTRLMWRKKQ